MTMSELKRVKIIVYGLFIISITLELIALAFVKINESISFIIGFTGIIVFGICGLYILNKWIEVMAT